MRSASIFTPAAPSGGTGVDGRHSLRPAIQYAPPSPTASYAPIERVAHWPPARGRKSRLAGSRSCSYSAPAELSEAVRAKSNHASTSAVDGFASEPPVRPRKAESPLPTKSELAFSYECESPATQQVVFASTQ